MSVPSSHIIGCSSNRQEAYGLAFVRGQDHHQRLRPVMVVIGENGRSQLSVSLGEGQIAWTGAVSAETAAETERMLKTLDELNFRQDAGGAFKALRHEVRMDFRPTQVEAQPAIDA